MNPWLQLQSSASKQPYLLGLLVRVVRVGFKVSMMSVAGVVPIHGPIETDCIQESGRAGKALVADSLQGTQRNPGSGVNDCRDREGLTYV